MKDAIDLWSGLDLRHLAAFQAVIETGSFAHAAEKLGYTQPAISHQIATLEQIVGQRLFDRKSGGRNATVTAAGALFGRHVDVLVSRLAAARADLDALERGDGGSLRIGAFQSVCAQIAPLVAETLAETNPTITLELIESGNEDALFGMLANGELDYAFTLLPVDDACFAAIELLRDPYYLVAAIGDARLETIESLTDLEGHLLVAPRTCRSSEMIDAQLQATGIAPEYAVRTDDNFALKRLVETGVGLAFFSKLALDTVGPGLAATPLDGMLPDRRIALTWSRDRELLPGHEQFVDLVQKVCRRISEPTPTGVS
jgi:DNA-binding transcriptional LysR family regulator